MSIGEIIKRNFFLLFSKDEGIKERFVSFMKKKGYRWIVNCEDPEFLLYCFITDIDGLDLHMQNFTFRELRRMRSLIIDLRSEFISVPG